MNHRIVISRFGAPETLKLIEEEIPEPKPGEVLVRVQASGIAFGDVLKREGLIPGMPNPPYTPGYDVAGRVVRIGGGVEGFQSGDHVVAFLGNHGHTEWICVASEQLVRIGGGPAASDPVIAASLILNYVSALQMIEKVARVQAGDRILVHGAAGGAGTAFLQLGKLLGLEVFGTASLPKHALVRELGANPIDYKREDFVAILQARGGANAVFDPMGGAHLARSRAALAKGGTLVVFGTASSLRKGFYESIRTFARFALYKILPSTRKFRFYGIGSWPRSSNAATIRQDLSRILAWHAEGKLNPVIGATFRLEQADEAYRFLESAQGTGKIVLISE